MACIKISDLYRGEGPGEKYGGILNAVFHEIFTKGIPAGCGEQTWIELLTVKHTFLVAERIKTEGDAASELSEAALPSCLSEKGITLCSGAHCAPQKPAAIHSGEQNAPSAPNGTRMGVTE